MGSITNKVEENRYVLSQIITCIKVSRKSETAWQTIDFESMNIQLCFGDYVCIWHSRLSDHLQSWFTHFSIHLLCHSLHLSLTVLWNFGLEEIQKSCSLSWPLYHHTEHHTIVYVNIHPREQLSLTLLKIITTQQSQLLWQYLHQTGTFPPWRGQRLSIATPGDSRDSTYLPCCPTKADSAFSGLLPQSHRKVCLEDEPQCCLLSLQVSCQLW